MQAKPGCSEWSDRDRLGIPRFVMRNKTKLAVLVLGIALLASPSTVWAQQPVCGTVQLYAPHIAVGWQPNGIQWFTIVEMFNNTAEPKNIQFTYVSTHNITMSVHETLANGAEVDATTGVANVGEKSGFSKTLSYCRSLPSCSSNLQTGWIVFVTTSTWSQRIQDCVPDIQVTITFQSRDVNGIAVASVGTPFVPADTRHATPAVSTPDAGVGLAIANPNVGTAVVTLRIFEDSGRPIATTTLNLGTGSQTSAMLADLFAGNSDWQAYLAGHERGLRQGYLEISSTLPVAVLAIRADRTYSGNWLMSGRAVFPGQDR